MVAGWRGVCSASGVPEEPALARGPDSRWRCGGWMGSRRGHYFPKVSMRGSDLTSWIWTTRSIADMVPLCRLLETR